jgi:adenylylsulfate reductase, subunit B
MPPIIDPNKCNGCKGAKYQICVEHCITDVFLGSKQGSIPVVKYPDECFHDNACVLNCPMKAIELRIPLPMTVVYK